MATINLSNNTSEKDLSEMRDKEALFAMYKSLGGVADEAVYYGRLRAFFLHTLMAQLGYDAEICGLPLSTGKRGLPLAPPTGGSRGTNSAI